MVGVFTRSGVAMKQAVPGHRGTFTCERPAMMQVSAGIAATGIGSERCRMPTDSRLKTADAPCPPCVSLQVGVSRLLQYQLAGRHGMHIRNEY